MWNIDFRNQLEQSRGRLFGNRDPRNLPASVAYYPPPGVRILRCVLDTNGEWVPERGELEKGVSYSPA